VRASHSGVGVELARTCCFAAPSMAAGWSSPTAVLGVGWNSLSRVPLCRGGAHPHAPVTIAGWSSLAAVLGAGWSSPARAALPRWSSPSTAAGRSSPTCAIHGSGVELGGGCPRGGTELTCTCRFATAEVAIHGSGAKLACERHPW
jgi:hypothetical protein